MSFSIWEVRTREDMGGIVESIKVVCFCATEKLARRYAEGYKRSNVTTRVYERLVYEAGGEEDKNE